MYVTTLKNKKYKPKQENKNMTKFY